MTRTRTTTTGSGTGGESEDALELSEAEVIRYQTMAEMALSK